MKRIAIDCRFAGTKTGLGRYSRELVTALVERRDDVTYILLIRKADEAWLRPIRNRVEIVVIDCPHYSLREQWMIPRAITHAKADLFFALHFNVPLTCPVPFVVTIHDLILHRFPNDASLLRRLAYKILISSALKRARAIIAVSQFTQEEIEELYGKEIGAKVRVVYEGVGSEFHRRSDAEQNAVCEKYGIQKPFFLYVGNAKEHKNIRGLLQAFRMATTHGRSLVLVTSGREVDRLTLPDHVTVVESITDDDLPALYSAASAYVSASLYEGFGLPIAEAEACGTIVLAMNTSCMPEVASPEALLTNPDPEALAKTMSVPQDQLPVPHPRLWKWEETAHLTMEVLNPKH